MKSSLLCSSVIWSRCRGLITIGPRKIGTAKSRFDAIGLAIAWAKKKKLFLSKKSKKISKIFEDKINPEAEYFGNFFTDFS